MRIIRAIHFAEAATAHDRRSKKKIQDDVHHRGEGGTCIAVLIQAR